MPCAPKIGVGDCNTVMVVSALQPVGRVKVIVAVPAPTPVASPEVKLIFATVASVEDHVPLPEGSDSDVVKPAQTVLIPDIDAGKGFTVIALLTEQPVAVSW